MDGGIVDAAVPSGFALNDLVGRLDPRLRLACEPDGDAFPQSVGDGRVDPDVDRLHARCLDDHVRVACKFVMQSLVLDHPFDRRRTHAARIG